MEQVVLPLWSDSLRERGEQGADHPLETTSSEEVNAAFVSLQSAACLVIIPLSLYERRLDLS